MKKDWIRILREHTERYPLMEPQDYGKLIFQSEFGAEHMIADEESVQAFLLREWEELPQSGFSSPKEIEDIGGELCRFPLSACESEEAAALLAKLFLLTAQDNRKDMSKPEEMPEAAKKSIIGGGIECGAKSGIGKCPEAGISGDVFKEKIERTIKFGISGMEEWVKIWAAQGYPAVHHSMVYRDAYHPHYRLLRKEYAGYFPALLAILKTVEKRNAVIIAIDGRCGSGKTSLAGLAGRLFNCNIFHMDDYYLPMAKRVQNWQSVPAGNMDLERFRKEVLLPAKEGQQVVYCPYDCQAGRMKGKQIFKPSLFTVVEGSYSHHPHLAGEYDLKIFLTCPKEEQESRLRTRERSRFTAFKEKWIPMEENYFRHFEVEAGSDIVVDTGSFI
ncbi:MAG: hypothetical protein NC094_05695 [Bacteroidales bacterium]|nr:hypothetical protein [Lachnoclostridium sp.]MCM1384315.1 hypothetical protein [Lachnoclostridium sp.]MCM1464896.1 hypothetical protein [Bacteroidales bacterium]